MSNSFKKGLKKIKKEYREKLHNYIEHYRNTYIGLNNVTDFSAVTSISGISCAVTKTIERGNGQGVSVLIDEMLVWGDTDQGRLVFSISLKKESLNGTPRSHEVCYDMKEYLKLPTDIQKDVYIEVWELVMNDEYVVFSHKLTPEDIDTEDFIGALEDHVE